MMKKILSVLIIASLLLASCGSEENKTETKKPSVSLSEKIKAKEAKMTPEKPLPKNEGMDLAGFYLAYADSLPKDQQSPTYVLKASDLYGYYGMKSEQCHLYRKVFETWPNFKDADMAMYLYASALDSDFDDRIQAKEYYELYIKKYPNSIYVADAKARLETIDELSFKQLQEKIFNQTK